MFATMELICSGRTREGVVAVRGRTRLCAAASRFGCDGHSSRRDTLWHSPTTRGWAGREYTPISNRVRSADSPPATAPSPGRSPVRYPSSRARGTQPASRRPGGFHAERKRPGNLAAAAVQTRRRRVDCLARTDQLPTPAEVRTPPARPPVPCLSRRDRSSYRARTRPPRMAASPREEAPSAACDYYTRMRSHMLRRNSAVRAETSTASPFAGSPRS